MNNTIIFDHIIDNIYLGNVNAAENIDTMKNIDIIIDLSDDSHMSHTDKIYHRFAVVDKYYTNMNSVFMDTLEIITKNKDKKIFIHCQFGISRSVSVVINYLLHNNMTLKQAIEYIKSKRKQFTKPNIGFFEQLMEIERKIFGSNTITVYDFFDVPKIK